MNSQEREQVRDAWLNKYEPEPEPEPVLSRNTSYPMEDKPNYNPNPGYLEYLEYLVLLNYN